MNEIVMAVAFPWSEDFVEQKDECTYYGIKAIRHPIIGFAAKQKKQLQRLSAIVENFQPDVIHVFGTENGLGVVCQVTSVPVVVHIQGVLGAYFETFVPYNLSWIGYIIRNPKAYIGYNAWKKFIPRERDIFKHCRYFMGRTEWDKSITQLLSPDAKYFHCDEMLRPEILCANAWQYQNRTPIVISTTIGGPVYKGADVILRTAALLKREANIEFVWNVYGINDLKFAERLTGIKATDVDVVPCGKIDVDSLVGRLQSSSMYVHPAYIENSSNAICEAQCIGLPVIATHVGGTTSIVEHEKTGIIVPANDIYTMASQILRIANDMNLSVKLGTEARLCALVRHNPQRILEQLMHVYNEIVK